MVFGAYRRGVFKPLHECPRMSKVRVALVEATLSAFDVNGNIPFSNGYDFRMAHRFLCLLDKKLKGYRDCVPTPLYNPFYFS
ncbi:hypothetical protein CCP2SC5_290023 [Azospirillaceae bacterium]